MSDKCNCDKCLGLDKEHNTNLVNNFGERLDSLTNSVEKILDEIAKMSNEYKVLNKKNIIDDQSKNNNSILNEPVKKQCSNCTTYCSDGEELFCPLCDKSLCPNCVDMNYMDLINEYDELGFIINKFDKSNPLYVNGMCEDCLNALEYNIENKLYEIEEFFSKEILSKQKNPW